MNCPSEEILSAYADGEAAPAEGRWVSAHAEGCSRCGRSLRLTAALKSAHRRAAVLREAGDPKRSSIAALGTARGGESEASPSTSVPRLSFGLTFAVAAWIVVVLAGGVGKLDRVIPRESSVPLSALIAAHERYAMALPLARQGAVPEELEVETAAGSNGDSDEYSGG